MGFLPYSHFYMKEVKMLHFENDYNRGAHPLVIQALLETNNEGLSGYGMDSYTSSAIQKIRQAVQCPDAQVHFLAGGTQTNQLVISSLLASYEGVIAADTGHISVHEAGAIEFSGHKVLTLPHVEGKLQAHFVRSYLENFYADKAHSHMVFPGMVYVSHPTEYGTLYTKKELQELSSVCRQYKLPLFVDGARLGYALAAETDVDFPTLAELVDVFSIGGTKLGALMGEAIVFTKQNMPKNFTTMVKQHGALLAKGRVLGVQFDRLFTDGLYLALGKQGIDMSKELVNILKEKNYQFLLPSPTNQQFVIVPNEALQRLEKAGIGFSSWDRYDENNMIIRFVTSWSTRKEEIEALRELL